MSSTHANLVEGPMRRMVLLLLPVVMLPLGLAGVTVKPAMELRQASAGERDALARAAAVEELSMQLEAVGPAKVATEQAELLERALIDLIPAELGSLEVYSLVRGHGQQLGLLLSSLHVEDAEPFLPPSEGRCIGHRPVRIKGQASLRQANSLVDHLRAAGLPTAVRGFTFTRRPDHSLYDVELLLDVFHLVPPAAVSADAALAPEGEPLPQ